MFRINTTLAILFCFLTAGVCAQSLGDAQDMYESGLYFESIDAVNALEDDDPQGWFIKANCLHKLGNFEDANDCYKNARKKGCTDDKLRLNAGICSFSSGNLDQAEDDLWAYLGVHQNDATALYYMGAVAYMRQDMKRSEAYLELALEANPDYKDAMYLMGANKMERKKYAQAREWFEKTADYEPRSELNMAIAMIEVMNYTEAMHILTQLEKKPIDFKPEVLYYLGEVSYWLKNPEEACQYWQESARLGDEDSAKNVSTVCEQGKDRLRKKRRSFSEF